MSTLSSKFMGFSATTISVHLQNVKIFRNMLLPSYKYYTVQSYHTRLNPNHLTCGLNNLLRVKSYNGLCTTQSIHTTPVCLKTQKRNQKKKVTEQEHKYFHEMVKLVFLRGLFVFLIAVKFEVKK